MTVSNYIRNIFLILIILGGNLFLSYAQSFHVSHGASSVDIAIISTQPGDMYYALYKIKPSTAPTAASIKSPSSQNLSKSGTLSISSSEVGIRLVRTLIGLKDSATYYVYVMFEPDLGTTGTVHAYTVDLPKRQPALSYVSKAIGTLGQTVQYLAYKPESYLKDTTGRKFPLVLFFHGILSGSDVSYVRSTGLPQYIDQGNNLDFLIYSPRMTSSWPGSWYSPGTLDELFDKIKKDERVDTTKIYIAGLSGGGGGVYYFSAHRPNEIAAIWESSCVNVFWNTDFPLPLNYCLIKDIPLWGFHNSGDAVVTLNNSKEVVKQLNACVPGPIIAPKLTVYDATTHNSWTKAGNDPAIYKWLLGYTKPNPLNKQPQILNDSIINIVPTGFEFQIQADGSDADKTGILSYEWYMLKGSDVTIRGNYSRTLTLSDFKAGSYVIRLLITDGGGSRNYKDITLNVGFLPTGTDQEGIFPETVSFIFPNPVSEKLYFRVQSGETVAYKIRSLSGTLVLEGKSDTVNVASLPSGSYIVETAQGNYKFTKP